MGGSAPRGPSKSEVNAQRAHEQAMLNMQMQLASQQMKQQQDMLKYQMEQAEKQRLAAEEAAKQAAIQTQSATAQNAAQQNLQDVAQKIEGMNTMQNLADQSTLSDYQKTLTTGAENVTGGYDMSKAKESAMQNLGLASGSLPQTPSNLIGSLSAVNPAMTTAATNMQAGGTKQSQNQFNMPNTSGLVFGGT
jgi:membrane-associated HD superfamily phosphohydrolase